MVFGPHAHILQNRRHDQLEVAPLTPCRVQSQTVRKDGCDTLASPTSYTILEVWPFNASRDLGRAARGSTRVRGRRTGESASADSVPLNVLRMSRTKACRDATMPAGFGRVPGGATVPSGALVLGRTNLAKSSPSTGS